MFNIRLSVRECAGHGVVALRGELDVTDAPGTASYLITAAAVYGQWVIVDLAGLDCIDAAGLGALERVLKQARRRGGDLPLAAPQDLVRRLLTATGLIEVFSVYPSVEQAVRGAEEAVGSMVAASRCRQASTILRRHASGHDQRLSDLARALIDGSGAPPRPPRAPHFPGTPLTGASRAPTQSSNGQPGLRRPLRSRREMPQEGRKRFTAR